MTYLLDTNVISERRKVKNGQAAPGVVACEQTVRPAELFLLVITVQELDIGVLLMKRKAPEQGQVLRAWLDGQVLPAFQGRLLPTDERVTRRSAHLHVPNPRPVRDGLIAATALVHGLSVVTRNVRDFAGAGVDVVNPWEAEQ